MEAKTLEQFDREYYRLNFSAAIAGGIFFAGRLMESFAEQGNAVSRAGIIIQIVTIISIIIIGVRHSILKSSAKAEPALYDALINNEQRRHYNLLSYKWALFTIIGVAFGLAFADKWIGMPVATFTWIIVYAGIMAGAAAWLIYNRR